MDPVHLKKLLDEQEKGLEASQESLLQWEKFRKDYTSLKEMLETLPHKVTHDVMVPFGPLAFVPGTLRHTNEILVLLGDNWFAERSCHQAVEIVDRRLEQCDDHIKKLKEEQRLLRSWQEQTETLQKDEYLSELTEPYDEAKEKQWRERHKVLAAEERKKKKEEHSAGDDEWMKKLEELEILEEMRNEMKDDDDYEDEDESISEEDDQPVPERITQNEQESQQSWTKSPSIITFNHTPNECQISEDSPADVYTLMEEWTALKPPLKSILKRSQEQPASKDSSEQMDGQEQKSVQFQLPEKSPRSYEAFCNWFKTMESPIQHETPDTMTPLSQLESKVVSDQVVETSTKTTVQEQDVKPMSRFKAMRSKK